MEFCAKGFRAWLFIALSFRSPKSSADGSALGFGERNRAHRPRQLKNTVGVRTYACGKRVLA